MKMEEITMNEKLHATGYVALVEALAAISKRYEIKDAEEIDAVLGGMQEAINDLSLSGEEEEEREVLIPDVDTRIRNIQFADSLVRYYAPYFPKTDDQPDTAPMMYWLREGISPALYDDLEWVATNCYIKIMEAYNHIREIYLPKLPDLEWGV